jgi:hypothetical protein
VILVLARDPSGLSVFSVNTRILESFNYTCLPSLRITVIRLFGPVVSLSPIKRAMPFTAGIGLPARSIVTVPLSKPTEPADACAHAWDADASRTIARRPADAAIAAILKRFDFIVRDFYSILSFDSPNYVL